MIKSLYNLSLPITLTILCVVSATFMSAQNTSYTVAGRAYVPLYDNEVRTDLLALDFGGETLERRPTFSGAYMFTNIIEPSLSFGGTLRVDTRRAVTTYDLYLLSQHILRQQVIEDPLILLAADVNNSGAITAFDMALIRQFILGQREGFASNSLCRVIKHNHDFANPENPWQDQNHWVASFSNQQLDTFGHDIDLLQYGDLNPSPSLVNRSTAKLFADDRWVEANETVTLTFHIDQEEMQGFQFGLFTTGDVKLLNPAKGVRSFIPQMNEIRLSGLKQHEPHLDNEDEGNSKERSSLNKIELSFTPSTAGYLSELIEFSNRLATEAFDDKGSSYKLELYWNREEIQPQVFPNPFHDELRAKLDCECTIQLINNLGQIVETRVVGDGELSLNTTALTPGWYTLRVENNNLWTHHKLLKQ